MPEKTTKSRSKIDRIIYPKKKFSKKNITTNEKKEKFRFIVMRMTWDQALSVREKVKKQIEDDPFLQRVKIRNLKLPEDGENFVTLYNRVFITCPDPYRGLTLADLKYFKEESTFVAFVYNKMIGFIILTIEPLIKTINGENVNVGKTGCIAGIGVDPRYRRRKIAMALVAKAAEYLLDEKKVDELVCEVFEDNRVSYNFITSFGMTPTGEIYL